MIIDRFGSTYSSAYQLPILQGQDDWQTSRPPVTAQVGGMNGAFDFYGSNNYPLEALLIKKSFMLADNLTVTGVGTISMTIGTSILVGAGNTFFLTNVIVGDYITVTTDAGVQAGFVLVVSDNDHVTLDFVAAAAAGTTPTYTVKHKPTFARTEAVIDALKLATINAGESKLWGLLRTASQRWGYAKCTALSVPENYQNKLAVPVSIEFMLREGVWYGATQSGTSITQATASYTLTNAGSTYANFELTITSSVGTLTAVTITNTTNSDTFTYTGSAAVGKTVIVKTGAYTITNNGAGAYAGLTYGANQVNWLRLNPGANTVTISVTGSTAWSGSMAWWDTYL